jgi:hypothetical protein
VSASRADLRAGLETGALRLGKKVSLKEELLLRPSWYSGGRHRFLWGPTTTLEVKASRALTTKLGYFENHVSGSSPFRFDEISIRRGFLAEVDADLSRRWGTRLLGEYDLRRKSFRDAEIALTCHGDCLDYSIGWRKLKGTVTAGIAFPANAFGP